MPLLKLRELFTLLKSPIKFWQNPQLLSFSSWTRIFHSNFVSRSDAAAIIVTFD